VKTRGLAAAALAASIGLTACSGGAGQPAGDLPAIPNAAAAASPIKHVILMIQENRSFDDLFATYPGADGATAGKCHHLHGTRDFTYPLHKAPLLAKVAASYAYGNFAYDVDGGKMDGFCDAIQPPYGRVPYQYVDPADIKPYWTIAQQYVLTDRLFTTMGSGSFTAHQDLIRGNTALTPQESDVDNPSDTPWGCGAPPGTVTDLLLSNGTYEARKGPFPCFTYRTLRDLLDAKGVSWKYYTPATELAGSTGGIWNAFFAIKQVYDGPEWKSNVTNSAPYEMQIFDDIDNGKLPAMSWVIPDAYNSDHPGEAQDTGPSWVAAVVNAVGKSQYWDSTAIIVVWDDWGGFYDHVPPPKLSYYSAGLRVPGLIVSPYVSKGRVDHTQYVFGSILEYVEDTFGLGHLGTTDVGVNSIGADFDYGQAPRAFVPISATYSRESLRRRPESRLPVDTY